MFGGLWARILAVVAAIGGVIALVLRIQTKAESRGARKQEQEAKDADQKRAKEIRRRVDAGRTARRGRLHEADDTRGFRD